MKTILMLISCVSMLGATGCVYRDHRGGGYYRDDGEYRGHARFHGRIEQRDPEVRVRIHTDD